MNAEPWWPMRWVNNGETRYFEVRGHPTVRAVVPDEEGAGVLLINFVDKRPPMFANYLGDLELRCLLLSLAT